ncbi:TetR/AcrR family transcriptional regulator [Methylocapsa palsarum]|uniref:DNA-binding transcriptional regulator, AcrR family n=1 Tax=Methylocapsa palsarum TaxID=1612308 RepID=A0A1I3W4H6_9HYPH|nr:TetR/AcrR family transcriptional regulator [Methylocapsa palsarum]SFK01547.1 DNA-binding transcriptional regulator, AcrR family [Methylocapsa palsarum]
MTQTRSSRRVPRGEKRRDEIAAVAERVFLERGYSETTMQHIADYAGASKETLYRHFGCKGTLFSEVMRRRSSEVMSGEEDGALCGSPPEVLFSLALNLLHLLTRADSLRLYRVVVAETPREPELGRIFYGQGPGRILTRLTDYLDETGKKGELNVPNPSLAARLFIGSVTTFHQIQGLAMQATFPDAELQIHAREAVALFLARYGA